MRKNGDSKEWQSERAAANGILNRRVFLEGAFVAAAAGAGSTAAGAEPLPVPSWMKQPGAGFSAYGQPSRFESKVVRTIAPPANPATQGIGTARTPLQLLTGMITPNGLHFDRSHSGTPDIDPDQHRLLIHGLVKRPLTFTLDALARYPMESRISFIECAGNSGALNTAQAQPGNAQAIHGLLSCAEWTGVRLATLLDEAGVEPSAKWVVAEGADSAAMSRSVPLAKCMDDALVFLYQNGERLRPSNGYPIRLLLPGFEGNMNVKWLRRLKLTDAPVMAKDETSKYTVLLPDGKAWQFVFPMEVKSIITHPSPGLALKGAGFYEIAGIARSRCPPTAAAAGRRRHCRSRCLRKRSRAFAPPGNGLVVPPSCKAVRPTTPAGCSRRALNSWRSAGCAGSITTMPSAPGGSTRKGRRAMHTLDRFASRAALMIGAAMICAAVPAFSAEAPRFGAPIAPGDLSSWDISIGPDGAGLPPGRGTPAQGEAVYLAKCQACHGEKGAGRPNDVLVGGFGTIASDRPAVKTVGSYWPYATTLFDYIRRAMPFNESKSLTGDEVYAVSAYILQLNGVIGTDDALDAQSLPKVKMPNRDGFIPFPR